MASQTTLFVALNKLTSKLHFNVFGQNKFNKNIYFHFPQSVIINTVECFWLLEDHKGMSIWKMII